MDQTMTLILSGLVMTGMVLMIGPRVLAANRGVALRNIAIWVAVFLALALAYTIVGPGKNQPIVQHDTPAEATALPDERPSEEDGFMTVR